MISLNQIVSNNLEILKSQEAELLRSLSFVQKAKQLFQAQSGLESTTMRKRGRPFGKTSSKEFAVSKSKINKRGKLRPGPKPGSTRSVSHLTNIMEILKQHGKPMSSAEIISALFKKQSADKDINHFRLLIYPVLTKAYISKTLKRKDGKIYIKK
jgi:hypothetical protein